MTRPGQPPPPDPWDVDLVAARESVDDIAVWVSIWAARTEPDAFARRCAGDAVRAADTAIAALHSTRARLVDETRRADDEAAGRADELLARRRDGPRLPIDAGDHRTRTSALAQAALHWPESKRDDGSGPAPREASHERPGP